MLSGSDDAHRGHALVLDHVAVELDRGAGLVRDSRVLGVALPTVDVADVEQPALVVGVQQNRVSGRDVPAVDIASEGALTEQ